ncbi:GntR family transcriptional regulator [Phreatobacter aquaticus]|nr:GntR family transcriptional regulator [Phreatobacter aquaticus]
MLSIVHAMSDRNGARAGTASALIHGQLREEILSLRRAPGSQLNERDIALHHGVSRTPVREAVLRLAEEGLIDIVSKSGTYVSRISLKALPEALVIRKVLEVFAVRQAVLNATESQILELRAIVALQHEAGQAGDTDAFHRADEAFHETIAIAGRHPSVWGLVKQVKLQVERYRRLTLPLAGRMPLVVSEHRAVLDCIAARDADGAADCLARHIDGLKLNLDDIRRINPDYFQEDVTRADLLSA